MKVRELQTRRREKKAVYFVIGLFLFNAFGMLLIGVIGVYTAEPMTTTTRETLEEDYGDGTVQERTTKVYYHERLAESVSNNVYEFFRYSLPVTMTGCFLVTLPEFSYDYIGVTAWRSVTEPYRLQ